MSKNNSTTLVPELRFPEFEGEWEEKKLSELLTFKNGLNASKEDYGHGYKFINVLDIIQNDFITHDLILGEVNVSREDFEKNIVEYGDILFQRSSETREEVGQANVYLDRDKPATFGGFVIRGKKKIEYDPSYMNALLKTSRTRKEITSKSGGSTRYNVGQDTLSEVKIYTTCIKEQQKIATFLTTIDQRIQLLQQKKAKLEEYKKGVMQQLFNQEIRFSEFRNHQFLEITLSSYCEVNPTNGILPQRFIYIDLESVNNGKLEKVNEIEKESAPSRAQRILQKGDILFQTVRPYQRNNYHFKLDGNYVASTGYAQIRFSGNSEYLFQYFHTDQFVNDVLRRCTGTSYPAINSSDLARLKIVIPHPNEQQKIADFLSTIDKAIERVNQQIKQTQQFKKGLLQKMFV